MLSHCSAPIPHCLQLPLALTLSCPGIPHVGQQGSEARVIRVSIDNDHGNLYRSILVRNGARDLLRAALPLGLRRSHLTSHFLFPAHESGQGPQCGAESLAEAQCGPVLGP